MNFSHLFFLMVLAVPIVASPGVSGGEIGPAPEMAPLAPLQFGFARPINPQWLPDDARQWQGYKRSVMLTDLSQVTPAAGLAVKHRETKRWYVLPFETAGFKGNALSIYQMTNPPIAHLALRTTGWNAIYVGVCTTAWSDQNQLDVKLSTSSVYRGIGNNLAISSPRRDVAQEQFLAISNLHGSETVDFKSIYLNAATVMYVRLVPITEQERIAWQHDTASSGRANHRTSIGTNDGYYPWIPAEASRAEDLLERFEGFQATDFGQWWFCPGGADLVCYPSKVGTLIGEGTGDFPRPTDEKYAHSLQTLIANGVNPLLVARQSARMQGQQFHILVRPAGFGASMPFQEMFLSHLYRDHPEWRCVDREGRQAMYMSYAVPEVRNQVAAILREAVMQSDPDGVGFFFNRGIPLMLWEKAFADRFAAEYHADLHSIPPDDLRIYQLRGKLMTEYLQQIRSMLDDIGRTRNKKHYAISAVTFTEKRFNDRFGLDVETWIQKGLIDQLGIASPTSLYDTENRPPDVEYYHRITSGTKVRIYPLLVAWKTLLWKDTHNLSDVCRLILTWYRHGANGVAVWDPYNGMGHGDDSLEGNSIDLLGYLGHRELIAYWAQHGVPLPNSFPLTKLGDNEYSSSVPNRGY